MSSNPFRLDLKPYGSGGNGVRVTTCLSQRQLHPERGALADAALDLHLPAVGLGHVLDDREAQARAPLLSGAALVHPVEALEDAGESVLRDADARVAHLQDGLAVGPREPDAHAPVRTVVLDRIVEEVEHE